MPLPNLPPIDTVEWTQYGMRQLRSRADRQLVELARSAPPRPYRPPAELAPSPPPPPAQPPAAGLPPAPAAPTPTAGTTRPSQFGQAQLSTAEALAACGPVAAMAFAQKMGRNPTAREAVDLAKGVGWTEHQGMAGPGSEKALLDRMGIASRLETGVDWAKVRADVEGGNPVIIDTPGHYFVAEGFDPTSGKFDFGTSATDLKGGARWMTPAELNGTKMGAARSALYLDNPDPATAPSVATTQPQSPRPAAAELPPIDRSSRAAFIKTATPYALRAQAETGIPADVMVGIAVNEGAAVPGTMAEKYNALFGIKASPGYQGKTTPTVNAWEVIGGKNTTQPSTFRAYDDPAESFADFGRFLQENPRYAGALKQTGDPAAFTQGLQAAGYATDPAWSNKVLSIAKEVDTSAGVPEIAPAAPGAAQPGAAASLVPTVRPAWMDRAEAQMATLESRYGGIVPAAPPRQAPLPRTPSFSALAEQQVAQTFAERAARRVPPPAPMPEPVAPTAPVPAPEPLPAPEPYVDPRAAMMGLGGGGLAPTYEAPEPEPLPTSTEGRAADYWGEGAPMAAAPQPAPPPEPEPTNPFERVGRSIVDALRSVPELAAPAATAAARGAALSNPITAAGALAVDPGAREQLGNAVGSAFEAARTITPTSIATRSLAGEEQIATETRPAYEALQAAIAQYGPDSAEAQQAADAYNAQTGALRSEGVYAAAERNPSLVPAELTTGVAASLAAGVIAPSAGAGLGRNIAAGVLDPTQPLTNVAPAAIRAVGRLGGPVAGAVPATVPSRAAVLLQEAAQARARAARGNADAAAGWLARATHLERLAAAAGGDVATAGPDVAEAVAPAARAAAEAAVPIAAAAAPPAPSGPVAARLAAEAAVQATPPLTSPGTTIARGLSDPSKVYEFRYRVVPLDELVTSHTDRFAVNPDYPAEIQPRIRDRVGSRIQIDEIARRLEPDVLLQDVQQLDRGPMIVGPDMVVESGNGRTIALRVARYERPQNFARYEQRLRELAPQYGINPAELDQVKDPVLVRERLTPVDRARFAQETNAPPVLAMSAVENAVKDAQRLPDAAITERLVVGENQSIDGALSSPANTPLVRSFIATLTGNERAGLLTPDGLLNQQGRDRLKAALFGKTYGGAAGQQLGVTFLESVEPIVKNVENGVFASLPQMARAEALIRAGERPAALSLTDDLAPTINVLARLRREGKPVADYLAQGALLERELTPQQEQMLAHLDAIGRSPRSVRTFLETYARGVEDAADVRQGQMLGGAPATKEGLLAKAIADSRPAAAETGGLFEVPTPAAAQRAALEGATAAPAPGGGAPLRPAAATADEWDEFERLAAERAAPEQYHGVGIPAPDIPIPGMRPHATEVPPSPYPGSRGAQALDKVLGPPVKEPNPGGWERVGRFATAAMRQTFDDRIDLKLAQRQVEKAYGGELPPELRAVELDRLTGGVDMAARLRVQRELETAYARAGTDQPALKALLELRDNVSKALSIGAREADATGGQLALLPGQSAAEARQFSRGLNLEDSRQALADLEARLGPERWAKVEDAANGVYDYVDSLRERMVEGGVWSRELADELKARYPHYIPTNIIDYMDDAAPRFGGGQKLGLSDAGLRRLTAEGTTKEREDVTAALVRMAFEVERRARKNEAGRAVYNWRKIDPDLASLMREVEPGAHHTKNEVPLYFFDQGMKREVLVDKEFAPVITYASKGDPGLAARLLAAPASLVRTTATERNPLFAIAGNPLLDMPTYLLRESSRYGVHHLPEIAVELAKSYGDAFAGLPQGELRGAGAQRLIAGGGGQFGRFGGTMKAAAGLAADVERRALGRTIGSSDDLAEFMKDVATFGWVPKVGGRAELAPRIAAMRLAEKYGADPQAAIMAGRTVTQDFTQGGLLTKALNQFIPFFNVATQSPYWFAQTARRDPKGALAAMTAIVGAPAVTAEAWNRSDPERAKAYDDIPDYVKDRGVIFMLPEQMGGPWLPPDQNGRIRPNYVMFPMRNMSTFAIAAREATSRVMGKATPRQWNEVLLGMVGQMSPVDITSGAGAVNSFVPAAISPVMQLAFNRDVFRQRAIVSDIADEQATLGSKRIAEGLQHLGLRDARPSQVEFVIRELGNGVAGMALAAVDMAEKRRTGQPLTGPNPALRDLPGVGGLIGRFLPAVGGQRDVDLGVLREETKRALLDERKHQVGNWQTLDQKTQQRIENEAGDVATRLVYGTDSSPTTMVANLRDSLKAAGYSPAEVSNALADLRKQLAGTAEAAAPTRVATLAQRAS